MDRQPAARAAARDETRDSPDGRRICPGHAAPDVVQSDSFDNTASDNTGTGYEALYHNSAVGATNMGANSSGNSNSSLGFAALGVNTTGSSNIAVGAYAGYLVTNGSNNMHIGSRGLAGDNAHIRIGTPGTHSVTYTAGISGTHVSGAPVYVTSSGQLGVLYGLIAEEVARVYPELVIRNEAGALRASATTRG